MSEEQLEDTFDTAEAPVDVEAEAAEMAAADGYPAETVDGQLVRITEKRPDPQAGTILVDTDGNTYTTEATHGLLVPAA
jgi:hypothetical protein